jgi:hypothetical protein
MRCGHKLDGSKGAATIQQSGSSMQMFHLHRVQITPRPRRLLSRSYNHCCPLVQDKAE